MVTVVSVGWTVSFAPLVNFLHLVCCKSENVLCVLLRVDWSFANWDLGCDVFERRVEAVGLENDALAIGKKL